MMRWTITQLVLRSGLNSTLGLTVAEAVEGGDCGLGAEERGPVDVRDDRIAPVTIATSTRCAAASPRRPALCPVVSTW